MCLYKLVYIIWEDRLIMVLIVNTTSNKTVTEQLKQCLNGSNAEIDFVEASELKINNCVGCNFCWLKTPGICSIHDDYEIILKKIIKADQLWVISDTALGFIDHKGKNIFDRILPIATMYLKFKDKEMRHVLRYDQKTDIGIIYNGVLDREYLARWNERAAINFESKSLGVFPVEELKEAAACMY